MRSSPLVQTSMDLSPSGNTEISIKQKFQAIWASLSLTMPVDYGDRLGMITKIILDDDLDELTELVKFTSDDRHLKAIDASIIAIAIGAYWHHDLAAVRSRLLELQNNCLSSGIADINIQEFVLAYAIAYGCQGKIAPKRLIAQICQDFTNIVNLSQRPEEQKKCLEQLQLAQKFVSQGASAIAAHYGNSQNSHLSDAIASSLYYVLSTSHNWSLITQRAQKQALMGINLAPLAPKLTTIQAGAIAAAYGALSLTSPIDQHSRVMGEMIWNHWAGVYSAFPASEVQISRAIA